MLSKQFSSCAASSLTSFSKKSLSQIGTIFFRCLCLSWWIVFLCRTISLRHSSCRNKYPFDPYSTDSQSFFWKTLRKVDDCQKRNKLELSTESRLRLAFECCCYLTERIKNERPWVMNRKHKLFVEISQGVTYFLPKNYCYTIKWSLKW